MLCLGPRFKVIRSQKLNSFGTERPVQMVALKPSLADFSGPSSVRGKLVQTASFCGFVCKLLMFLGHCFGLELDSKVDRCPVLTQTKVNAGCCCLSLLRTCMLSNWTHMAWCERPALLIDTFRGLRWLSSAVDSNREFFEGCANYFAAPPRTLVSVVTIAHF